jgi:hypothetical protein
MPADGLARSTFYDEPVVAIDDTAFVEAMSRICEDAVHGLRDAPLDGDTVGPASDILATSGGQLVLDEPPCLDDGFEMTPLMGEQ